MQQTPRPRKTLLEIFEEFCDKNDPSANGLLSNTLHYRAPAPTDDELIVCLKSKKFTGDNSRKFMELAPAEIHFQIFTIAKNNDTVKAILGQLIIASSRFAEEVANRAKDNPSTIGIILDEIFDNSIKKVLIKLGLKLTITAPVSLAPVSTIVPPAPVPPAPVPAPVPPPETVPITLYHQSAQRSQPGSYHKPLLVLATVSPLAVGAGVGYLAFAFIPPSYGLIFSIAAEVSIPGTAILLGLAGLALTFGTEYVLYHNRTV